MQHLAAMGRSRFKRLMDGKDKHEKAEKEKQEAWQLGAQWMQQLQWQKWQQWQQPQQLPAQGWNLIYALYGFIFACTCFWFLWQVAMGMVPALQQDPRLQAGKA